LIPPFFCSSHFAKVSSRLIKAYELAQIYGSARHCNCKNSILDYRYRPELYTKYDSRERGRSGTSHIGSYSISMPFWDGIYSDLAHQDGEDRLKNF
jgi:hypothetical protein